MLATLTFAGLTTLFIYLGQTGAGFDFGPLANVGAIGVVLAWLMWRVEPRLRSMESTINRQTRANMLMAVVVPHLIESVRSEAKKIIAEVDALEKKPENDSVT